MLDVKDKEFLDLTKLVSEIWISGERTTLHIAYGGSS